MRNKMILKIKNNEIKKIIDERIELLNNNYDGVIKILEKDGLSSFERQKEVDKLISNVGYIKKKLNLNSVKKLSEEIEDKKHLFSDSIRKFISFECNSDELAASCYFVINDLFFSNDEVSYGETNISLRLGYLVHNMIMQNKFYKSNSSDNFSEWMKENSYISDKKFLMELGFNLTNLLIKNEYLVHDLTFKNLKYYKININIKKNEFVNILNLPKLSQIPDYNINNLNSKFIHILDENTLNKFKISEKSVKALNIMKNTRFTINSTFLNNVLDENNIQSYLEEFIEDDLNIVIPSYFYDKMDSLTSTQERRLLRSKYDKVLFKLLYFIDILYISLLLEGRTIFFETFTDWRGRKYYKGYPLSPTAGSFIRSLLTFENTYSDIREKCSLSGDFSPIIKMEESGVIKYNDENHISLDATASGISILGLLSYDENIMGMTNIINIDNTKKDIYSEILNILNKNNEYLNITKGNNFLNRKNIKNLIMCMVYSEGSWSRSKKINNLALGLPGDKIIYKEIFEISKIIEKIFKEYSPKIVNFTNLVIKCLKTIMIKNKKEKNIDEFIILKSTNL